MKQTDSNMFSEFLVKNQYCSSEDIERMETVLNEYAGQQSNVLLNMGVIAEDELIDAYCKFYDIDRLIKEKIPFPLDFATQFDIPKAFFIINKIYPFYAAKEHLCVAVNEPHKIKEFCFIEKAFQKELKLFLGTENDLIDLKTYWEAEDSPEQEDSFWDIDGELDHLKEMASEAPIIKLVNSILSQALEINASDIHFESYKTRMDVRYRIDGILRKTESINYRYMLPVITRLKLLSNMNITESRLPQDGRFSLKIARKEIDIRASSVPTSFGESFVLRILNKESIKYSIDNLGFYSDNLEILKNILSRPHGLFLTTGPTGSGKTTTLYSILNEYMSEKIKIISVEDPVEYELDGIAQIQVNNKIGYTFADSLKSILRQDPDVIMIGEIRDVETAEIAIQSALTGHYVFSTLHTNSAMGAITRLLEMGIDFYLLKAVLTGVMSQRLVRTLCDSCSKQLEVTRDLKDISCYDQVTKFKKDLIVDPRSPNGCDNCNKTGYRGRTMISEIFPFTEELFDFFEKDKNFSDPNKLGFRNMHQDAMARFLQGQTGLEEILKVISNEKH